MLYQICDCPYCIISLYNSKNLAYSKIQIMTYYSWPLLFIMCKVILSINHLRFLVNKCRLYNHYIQNQSNPRACIGGKLVLDQSTRSSQTQSLSLPYGGRR